MTDAHPHTALRVGSVPPVTPTPGLAAVSRIADPAKRAAKAAALLERLRKEWEPQILEVRDGACRELVAGGSSAGTVADLIHTTRANAAKRFPAAPARRRKRKAG